MHKILDIEICLPFLTGKTTGKKGFHLETLPKLRMPQDLSARRQSLQSYIRITSIQGADSITKQCQVPRQPEALLSQVSENPQLQPLQQPLFLLCPHPPVIFPPCNLFLNHPQD